MTLKCRIKKALGTQSPSADGFCKVNLHSDNTNQCKRCKYFDVSRWIDYVTFFQKMMHSTPNIKIKKG